MQLILPVSGRSTHFTRPKYLLNHPNGNLMLLESIKGVDLKKFKKIYIICLKEHDKKYGAKSIVEKQFKKIGLLNKIKVVLVNQSDSQPHTVAQAIIKQKISGKIFIKDSDNFFTFKPTGENTIYFTGLNDVKKVEAVNKSYVLLSEENKVLNIVEKQVISDTFCVGGYSFASASEFVRCFQKIRNNNNIYVSHIIYQMMLEGKTFVGSKVENFLDWGTLQDWLNYTNKFGTIFVDLDGVLVYNTGEFMSPSWGETDAIKENVAAVNKLYDSGFVKVIITTTRTEEYAKVTSQQLKRLGIKYHQIILGLFHSKRIIVNDFSKTNPYRSCDAINIRRDSNELGDMLQSIFPIDN